MYYVTPVVFLLKHTVMADEYAEKMSRKPLSELLLYVQNRIEYREEAVLAALDELERRGEHPANAAALRAELQPVVELQRQKSAAASVVKPAPVDSVESVPTEEDAPALYSPGTIVLFSMLFSFLVGGILLVINMFKLKEIGKALRVILFIALMLGCYYAIQTAKVPYNTQVISSVIVQLVAIFAYLLYFWPRYVGSRSYVSRHWLPAMFICIVIIGGMYLLASAAVTSATK